MIRPIFILGVIGLAALGLAGCGGAAPPSAAESASRLLAAALKNDRVAFEAEIDRAAVRDDVRRQVGELARANTLEIEGGPSEFALDRMIGPDAVKLVDRTGARLTSAPSVGQVERLMKTVDSGRACLHDAPGHCLLTFAKGKGAKARGEWRLVGMRASGAKIEVAGD